MSKRSIRPIYRRVCLADCHLCGTPLVVGPVPSPARRALLPETPNTGPWRAFERGVVQSPLAWRSTKRFGFIPAYEGEGLLPHDCPNADTKKPGGPME